MCIIQAPKQFSLDVLSSRQLFLSATAMAVSSPGVLQGFGLPVLGFFSHFFMFGFHVKLLISRSSTESALNRLLNLVVNVDCPEIFNSFLVICCPTDNDSRKNSTPALLYRAFSGLNLLRGALHTAHRLINECFVPTGVHI